MSLELILWTSAFVGGLITAMIAYSKGRELTILAWFVFGALFFPVALTAVLLAERSGKNCPECAERIFQEARKCPYCGTVQENVKPVEVAAGFALFWLALPAILVALTVMLFLMLFWMFRG